RSPSNKHCYSPTTCLSFFTHPATPVIYTLSLHDALPIFFEARFQPAAAGSRRGGPRGAETLAAQIRSGLDEVSSLDEDRILRARSEEHTSELQSLRHLVCRLLLEKKKKYNNEYAIWRDDS